ncbi:Peptidase family M23 [Granulicella pectinivorans]|uniref:Peptidase family M23 n=1 Tax=Granulicella pectinivorans TaxID=474950 RepID=A0A1I6L8D2_9BACT|nr:M23 family metallopeptidase [Granulicella pectinivorans]SFR99677.1 Peptidase family M23 [Granulicella pectinivorans]
MRTPALTVPLVVFSSFLALTGCSKPTLDVPEAPTTIGQATPFTVNVHDAHGVSKLTSTLVQSGAQYQKTWQPSATTKGPDSSFNVELGTRTTPELHDGTAHLILEATSGGLLHKTTRWERDVNVVTQPPQISADSDQHYLYLGMADLATMNVTGSYTSAGVRVGDQTFRAWPMPGGKPGLFSLYAFAWNMPAGTIPMAYASNAAGNDVTTPLTVIFPKREQPVYTQHQIQITDQFMQKVLGELDPNGTGDPIARFVKINTEMRKANNKTLSDLRLKTADSFLWSQPFTRQAHSAAEATFADVRSYVYKGNKIDQQVHLGYDLAVTQHVGVEASNDGRIVWAAPLGIYGNCIVVDHGYGLQTIYGHLSRIDVHVGDMVKRSQVMGLSGMTGMAGGDHIHFAMQLDGVQIDPKEWWDAHWIKDHVVRRVDLPGFNQ